MRSAYGAKESSICGRKTTIVVDVANVMGSRPDGWWRDRPGAAVRLHGELAAAAAKHTPLLPDDPDDTDDSDDTEPEEIVMVLEGATRAAATRIEQTPIQIVLSGGSGDDTIVALVRGLPGRRVVVTADRELRRRCEAAGAEVLGPGWLLGLLRDR